MIVDSFNLRIDTLRLTYNEYKNIGNGHINKQDIQIMDINKSSFIGFLLNTRQLLMPIVLCAVYEDDKRYYYSAINSYYIELIDSFIRGEFTVLWQDKTYLYDDMPIALKIRLNETMINVFVVSAYNEDLSIYDIIDTVHSTF